MTAYTPSADSKHGNAGGRGEDYARFLIEEVKPFIDRQYRTQSDRDHTAVAGSSLGTPHMLNGVLIHTIGGEPEHLSEGAPPMVQTEEEA